MSILSLSTAAERVYPESQYGFCAGRLTIDMVLSLRQLQEKCREQQMPLYIAFIDPTKPFDLDGLFQILPKIGFPPKLRSMIKSLHTNMKGTVQFSGSSSRPFGICSGVKQGCILAPAFFGIFFALLLRFALGTASGGICLRTRPDGRIFNLGRLRARHAARGRCSSDDSHPAGAAGTDGPFLSGLQVFQADHKSKEDKRPGVGYSGTASHHHR